jgi:hypothetical protein
MSRELLSLLVSGAVLTLAMVKRLKELGVPAEAEIYEGKPHAWFNREPDLSVTVDRVEKFLEAHFQVRRIDGE